ncbi:hypothetical protein Tco_1581748, partial [Tanacetum coccineum]
IRVTARPSSSYEFPIAPVTAPFKIRRRSAILIRPREAIPFGRPYRTHLNRPHQIRLIQVRSGIVRSFEDMPIDLNDAVHEFYHHMSEVRIDRIVGIETTQRRLEANQLIARGQRVSMIERIDNLRLENLKVRAMLDIERDRVNSLRLHMSLSQEEIRQVRRDRDDTRGRLRRLESYVERRLVFRP